MPSLLLLPSIIPCVAAHTELVPYSLSHLNGSKLFIYMYVKALGLLHASTVLYSQYIFSVVGPNLPPEQLASILSTLLDGLQGRTWDGKVISTDRAKSFYYVLSVIPDDGHYRGVPL